VPAVEMPDRGSSVEVDDPGGRSSAKETGVVRTGSTRCVEGEEMRRGGDGAGYEDEMKRNALDCFWRALRAIQGDTLRHENQAKRCARCAVGLPEMLLLCERGGDAVMTVLGIRIVMLQEGCERDCEGALRCAP
jgi:hypothetical protein